MANVGDVLSFMFHGQMQPFQIKRIINGIYYIQSLDFGWEAKITDTAWKKQKELLEKECPDYKPREGQKGEEKGERTVL